MTPADWLLTEVIVIGFSWMFGGALLCVGIGALVGWRRDAGAGIGSALLVWGLGNVAVAGLAAWVTMVDTTVVTLLPSRCEPSTSSAGKPQHQHYFAVPRADGATVEVRNLPVNGVCPEEPRPEALRVRREFVSGTSTASTLAESADEDAPLALMVTWGLFGSVACLMGGILWSTRSSRPKKATPAAAARPVAPWRRSLGETIALLGLLVLVAAFVGPFFLDGSTERSLQFGFRAAGTALALWIISGRMAASLAWSAGFFLALFSAVMFGIAELLKRSA